MFPRVPFAVWALKLFRRMNARILRCTGHFIHMNWVPTGVTCWLGGITLASQGCACDLGGSLELAICLKDFSWKLKASRATALGGLATYWTYLLISCTSPWLKRYKQKKKKTRARNSYDTEVVAKAYQMAPFLLVTKSIALSEGSENKLWINNALLNAQVLALSYEVSMTRTPFEFWATI